MQDFARKTVLITGAAGGIGRALCAEFVAGGAAILALDRDAAVSGLAAALSARMPSMGIVADISDEADVTAALQRAMAEAGPVDVLINNAAIATSATLAGTTAATWRLDIDVVLNGAYYCTQAVLPAMRERGGAIINVGSVNGLTALGHPAYSAAKAALISYTRSLAVEYGRFGIRANCICPGTVRTPIWQARVDKNPQIFEQLRKWYPLGQVAEPQDVAKAARFLASSDARIITGAVLNVDGGLMAGNAVMAAELTLEAFSEQR